MDTIMKFDKAYSKTLDDCVTIYELRDLIFSEDGDYELSSDLFLCPNHKGRLEVDNLCALTTFNARSKKYKKTPHFKDKKSTKHWEFCPYDSPEKDIIDRDPETSHDEGIKYTNHPSEFLLERKKYVRKKKRDDEGTGDPADSVQKIKPRKKTGDSDTKSSPNKTSIFEHIVESFVANKHDRSALKAMPLTIGDLRANYNFFFKQIRYFEDREGLIYWGRVKQIKDYKFSFSVIFEDRVSGHSISAYIPKASIADYYKRTYFEEKIREFIDLDEDIDCFFLSAYPHLKTVQHNGKEFEVYDIEINNLNHFMLRIAE